MKKLLTKAEVKLLLGYFFREFDLIECPVYPLPVERPSGILSRCMKVLYDAIDLEKRCLNNPLIMKEFKARINPYIQERDNLTFELSSEEIQKEILDYIAQFEKQINSQTTLF